LTAGILVAVFAVPRSLLAEIHVVSRADLHKEMIAATQARKRGLETINEFLSSQTAQNVVKSAHMDPVQVKTAVSSLSDQELAQLATKAQKAQAEFAAGKLSDRDLILIILGIAALVVIIVAVQHDHH
jgi:hypothetical protein